MQIGEQPNGLLKSEEKGKVAFHFLSVSRLTLTPPTLPDADRYFFHMKYRSSTLANVTAPPLAIFVAVLSLFIVRREVTEQNDQNCDCDLS